MKTQFLAILSFGAFAAFGQGRVAYEPWVEGKVQAVKSTADGAAAQVRALNGVVTGDDFAIVVTNYDSVMRMPSLSARYKLQDGSGRYGEVWNELTRWKWFFGTWWPSNAYTKAQADARFADKAWGQYESGTGYDSPDGRLWVTQPVVMSSGMAYMPHTMESGGAIWVLTANGLAPSVTPNGFFRLSDDTGKTLFEVVKGDKELVGAYCSDIKTQSQPSAPPIVTLEFAVDLPPTVEATVHVEPFRPPRPYDNLPFHSKNQPPRVEGVRRQAQGCTRRPPCRHRSAAQCPARLEGCTA